MKVARYGKRKVAQLLSDPGIVRNRLKVESAVANAKAVLAVRKEFGSFDSYIWSFVGGRTIVNRWNAISEIPVASPEAHRMSEDLKARGFRFVGPTICYAFMQSVGMVNDHTVDCHRHREISGSRR